MEYCKIFINLKHHGWCGTEPNASAVFSHRLKQHIESFLIFKRAVFLFLTDSAKNGKLCFSSGKILSSALICAKERKIFGNVTTNRIGHTADGTQRRSADTGVRINLGCRKTVKLIRAFCTLCRIFQPRRKTSIHKCIC